MKTIVTLVASRNDCPVREDQAALVTECLGLPVVDFAWLDRDKAADFVVDGAVDTLTAAQRRQLEDRLDGQAVDVFFLDAAQPRRKRLLVADMDNTMVIGETLDDLAEQCGLKDEVAAITDRAMRGELNFKEALRERVTMLAGLELGALERTRAAIRFMPGGKQLVETMRADGAQCILVSGGFSCFTTPVAADLGFTTSHGNELEIADGRLTGRVIEPIVDFQAKLDYLNHYLHHYTLSGADALAIGDGANDYAMLGGAGLGVGYHPKPFLRDRVRCSILHGDLSALLYAQGFSGLSE